jgi:Mlc titration factor MtfA (ptsG expression regulator)
MIFLTIITIILFLITLGLFIGVFIGILDYFSVKLAEKPFYIHFYPVKLDLPIPKHQVLKNHFAFYNRLSPKQQQYFRHRIVKFIRKYKFISKEDLEITDEMKIIIAATAVKLTFGMRKYLVDVFDKIIVYPKAYFSTVNEVWHKGEFNPRMKAIVFSWEDFMEGIQNENDNYNLGLHEFTHAIHFHGKKSDDISALLFVRKFNKIIHFIAQPEMQKRLEKANYLRSYAYTNQFEFIAVLMEHFFETPDEFKRDFPELYDKVRKMINFQEKS